MKIEPLILLLMIAFSFSCSKESNFSKGKFFSGRIFKTENYFTHFMIQGTTQLRKTGDTTQNGNSGYGYYSWKTIKTIFPLSNDQVAKKAQDSTTYISVYTTITNDSLLNFTNEKLRYIEKENNVQINNLYFIDDYRCIYLSYDDNRTKLATYIIPLYFSKNNYRINKDLKKRFRQYLRGYYTINKNKIAIHFESPYDSKVNYFVNGEISDNNKTIKFNSMSIPFSQNELYENGYNPVLNNFTDIFHLHAQPIFEIVDTVSDLIYPSQFYVSLGFELFKKNKNMPNKLHTRLINKYKNELKINDTLILHKVVYKISNDKNINPSRVYHVYKYYDKNKKMYSVEECIGSYEDIDTW